MMVLRLSTGWSSAAALESFGAAWLGDLANPLLAGLFFS